MAAPKINGLNPRQHAFVSELMKDASNPGKAYLKAGYKAKNLVIASNAASNLTCHPLVRAEITRRLEERAKEDKNTDAYVVSKLIETAERCSQAIPVLDVMGMPTGIYEYRPMAVLKAVEHLARIRGMFVDKSEVKTTSTVQHTLSLEQAGVSLEAVKEALQQLRARKQLDPSTVLEHRPPSLPVPSQASQGDPISPPNPAFPPTNAPPLSNASVPPGNPAPAADRENPPSPAADPPTS